MGIPPKYEHKRAGYKSLKTSCLHGAGLENALVMSIGFTDSVCRIFEEREDRLVVNQLLRNYPLYCRQATGAGHSTWACRPEAFHSRSSLNVLQSGK